MKKIFVIVVCCLLFVVVCLSGSYFLIKREINIPFKTEGREMIFEIKEGQGIKEVAQGLEKSGLIKNKFYFLFWIIIEGKGRRVLSGNYCLTPKMSILEIIEKLTTEGESIPLIVRLTFPEGWRIEKIEERLKLKGLIEKGDILTFKIKDFKEDYSFLSDAPDEASLEGYLFPDTYFFHCPSPQILCKEGKGEILKCGKGEKRTVIEKFLSNFDEKLTSDLREEIKRQKKSIFEIIIMASMIEKEVRDFEDKKLVSGILWKRFKNDIPLQVDATITFLTNKKTIKIPLEDLKIDSPYNTYRYKGLPPGPICNPGLESIKAAIFPKNSNFWYYLSTPDGKTIFSKTLDEHNLAKAKYLPR